MPRSRPAAPRYQTCKRVSVAAGRLCGPRGPVKTKAIPLVIILLNEAASKPQHQEDIEARSLMCSAGPPGSERASFPSICLTPPPPQTKADFLFVRPNRLEDGIRVSPLLTCLRTCKDDRYSCRALPSPVAVHPTIPALLPKKRGSKGRRRLISSRLTKAQAEAVMLAVARALAPQSHYRTFARPRINPPPRIAPQDDEDFSPSAAGHRSDRPHATDEAVNSPFTPENAHPCSRKAMLLYRPLQKHRKRTKPHRKQKGVPSDSPTKPQNTLPPRHQACARSNTTDTGRRGRHVT